jgi:5'-nucleotidase
VAGVEEGKGQFPQVGGLRFSFDASQPVGSRVQDVQVMVSGSYVDLDLDAEYTLASNDFMRGGGDAYTMFAENAIDPYDAGAVLADAVAEYIGSNSPVAAQLEGRITDLAPAATPEAEAEGEAEPTPQVTPEPAPTPAPEPAAAETAAAVQEPMTAEEPAEPMPMSGTIVGASAGAFASYEVAFDTSGPAEVTVSYAPENPVVAGAFGFDVYGPSGKVASGEYAGNHGERSAAFDAEAGVTYKVQIRNYLPGVAVSYEVSY